jgi:energy-coupling factor transport system ATP-binding protein
LKILSFKDYSFSYSADSPPALRGINLEVEERESVIVSGLSGSGKTTLLLAAAGLLETYPAAGQTGSIARSRTDGDAGPRIAVVLQNFYSQITYLRSTVFEEIAFACENAGLPREETARRVGEAMEKIRIGHLAHRNPLELSGGEKQKVVLASALAVKPDLLILDEPLSQLDPETTSYLAGILAGLKGEIALLIAENDPYLPLKVADRLVILANGMILADGRPDAVIDRSTAEHLDLPAWTVCLAEATRRGVVPEEPGAAAFELNYRKAIYRLRNRQ